MCLNIDHDATAKAKQRVGPVYRYKIVVKSTFYPGLVVSEHQSSFRWHPGWNKARGRTPRNPRRQVARGAIHTFVRKRDALACAGTHPVIRVRCHPEHFIAAGTLSFSGNLANETFSQVYLTAEEFKRAGGIIEPKKK